MTDSISIENDEDDTDPRVTPVPLPYQAEAALRLLRNAEEHLASKRRGKVASALACIQGATRDLERGLAVHTEVATRELREVISAALGPNLTWGEFIGARRAFETLLAAMDVPQSSDAGGAA